MKDAEKQMERNKKKEIIRLMTAMKAKEMLISQWLNILLYKRKPMEFASTTLGEGLKHLAIAAAIFGLIIGVLDGFTAFLGGYAGIFELEMIVYYLIFPPIGAVLAALIGSGLLHIFSKIVGGKGSYGNYVGVLAKIQAAILGTAGIAILILSTIAVYAAKLIAEGTVQDMSVFIIALALAMLLTGLWWIVLAVLATIAVQKISAIRAAVAVIIAHLAIVIILIVPLFIIVFYIMIGLNEFMG